MVEGEGYLESQRTKFGLLNLQHYKSSNIGDLTHLNLKYHVKLR